MVATTDDSRIDRRALVTRHAVRLDKLDAACPLTVGNGEFAFSADVTGLQTFSEAYSDGVPLCTLSQWGWHSFPPGPDVHPDQVRYTPYDTYGRPVPYLTSAKGQEATFKWLRENPHRLNLGRIGFRLRTAAGADAKPADLSEVEQTLNLWTGLLTSRFTFDGQRVEVETCCLGDADGVAVRVRSPLMHAARVAVVVEFPYGSPEPSGADWKQPDKHTLVGRQLAPRRFDFSRQVDETIYHVGLAWEETRDPRSGESSVGDNYDVRDGEKRFELVPAPGTTELACVFAFSPAPPATPLPTFEQAKAASAAMWEQYWQSGAAIDLAGSADPRANELERRIVLSQYLMRANCAGSLPPAETGLTCNSWFGKFHLEMHWWHGVHFALWDRLPLLQKSLSFYNRILPEARKIAARQGYAGVRWPKMTDGRGIDSPSPVGPLLIWQQPHPIYYAELCYRREPTEQTIAAWREIVDQTAEFMASYAVADAVSGHYSLGPPIKSVQENNDTKNTRNPTFELTYWRYGLRTAQKWRERQNQPRKQQWDAVLDGLAPPPNDGGLYLYHDGLTDTYTKWNWEHPAFVGALGMLNGEAIDEAMMRRSVEQVMKVWQWDRCWGWDFPLTAMAAARCGRPDLAIDALLLDSKKNGYAANGHVYQRPDLPLYLPANGGLLSAIAMMAGGWDGGPEGPAPGFPKEGWTVRSEGLRPMP